MTKLPHNQTFKLAVFYMAVIAVFMGATTVSGRAMSSEYNTTLSKLQVNKSSFDDTTGLVCPEDITTYTDLNSCETFISSGLEITDPTNVVSSLSWIIEGATEGKSSTTGINQLSSFIFNEGTTTVTYQGKDRYNNIISCSFAVTVVDNQVPTIENPLTNITIEAEPGDCGAEVSWGAPKVSDNCTSSNQILLSSSHVSGSWFAIGTTRVTYKLNDGLENEFSFNVIVVDNEIPVFTAPKRVSVNCDNPVPDAYINLMEFIRDGGNVADDCEIDTESFRFVNEIRTSTTCPFTITRTYRVQDVSGNVAEVDHHIRVLEQETLKSAKAELTAQTGNWSSLATWGGGALPTSGDNVTIPSGVTVTVDITTAVCNNITIESGGTLIISGSNTLKVYGSWSNSGTFNAGTNGSVEFTGTNDVTINGTNTFENLIISKGSLSTSVTVSGNTTVSSGGLLTMNSGLVTIGSGANFSLDYSSGLAIPSTAGFDINGGTLTTGNFSITNNGLIRVTTGTANFGTNPGNTVHTQGSGAFIVFNGTVDIAGRLESTAAGTLSPPGVNSGVTISGGTVTLSTAGNNLSGVGSLNVTSSGDFYFTGGTIVFENPSTATTELDLGIIGGSGTKNISGGTFQFGNAATNPNSVFILDTDVPLSNLSSSSNADLLLNSNLVVSGSLSLNSATSIELNGYSLQREVSGNGTYTFPIADGSGNSVEVTITINGTFGGNASIEITTTDGDHPNNASAANYLNQYWSVVLHDITNPNYSISANYQNSDIIGTESEIAMGVWTGVWNKFGVAGTNTISASGITSTSIDFTGITLDAPTVEINGGTTNEEICTGSSVVLTAAATGDPNLLYAWSPSSGLSNASVSNPSASPVSTTAYTVTVTDGNGFTTTDNIQVIVNPLPTASISGTTTVCQNDPQPVISFAGANGTAPYTFTYNIDGAGSFTVPSVGNNATVSVPTASSGTRVYNLVSVLDANGCSQSQLDSESITINPLPTASISGTTTVCQDATEPQVVFIGANGTVPYKFTYNINGIGSYTTFSTGNTAVINVPTTSSGLFTYNFVSVEDANGCVQAQTVSAAVTVTLPISALAANTDPIVCYNGTGTVQISASGGTPPYTYNLQGKPANNTGVFAGVSGSVAGSVYTWIVTDANGCAAVTGTISVTQPEELTASSEVMVEIDCYAGTGTVRINAAGGTGPLSYTLNGITKLDGVFAGITDGTWSWSVDDAEGCGPVTGNITIVEPTEITIDREEVTSEIMCNGGTGTVTIEATNGTGPYVYTFNGQINTTGVFTGVYAGVDYSYSILDANNCGPIFGSITVPEPDKLVASAIPTHVDCNGGSTGSIDLSVIGGTTPYTFAWTNGAGIIEDPANLAAGTYSVTVTDLNGCIATTSAIVTESVKVMASETHSNILCFGGNSTVQITASGGTLGYQYSVDGGTTYQASNSFTLSAGNYTVKVSDSKSCASDDVTLTITDPALLTVAADPVTPVCEGATLSLSALASGGTAPLTYSWTGPNSYSVNNAQNPSIVNAPAMTNESFAVTVTDANGCTASATTNATVYATPDIIANPASDEFCSGSSTNISLSSSVSSPDFNWIVIESGVSGASNGSGNTISQTLTATGNEPGTATYTVTPTANGCDGVPIEVVITVNPIPVLTVDNQTPVMCDNLVTGVVLTSNVANTTYSWTAVSSTTRITGFSSDSDTESNNDGVEIAQQLNYQGGWGSGVVTYTISLSANGCNGVGTTEEVEVISSDYDLEVILTSAAPPSEVCPGETVSLTYTGNSGRRWDTDFYWEVNTNQIGLTPTSGGPQIINGGLSFVAQNTTNEPITGIISIVPWAYNTRWNYYVCSGEPYTFSVTVNPYHIVCPTDTVVIADLGVCNANLSKPVENLYCYDVSDLSYTVNGGGSSSGNIIGYNFDVGSNTVIYNANDGSGHNSTCSFDVVVTDDQNPTISCPPNVTVNNDPGDCGALVPYTVTASDNCPAEVLSLTDGIGDGNFFPVGITTETWVVTDASGNLATCSFDVTVNDNEAPALTCVSDPIVCAPAAGSYVHPDISWDPSVSEICSGNYTLEYELNGDPLLSGTSLHNVTFPVGTTSVIWTATDISGNSNTCSFNVVVNEEPSIVIDQSTPSVCLAGAITLTSTATGTPAPTYQWRRKNDSGAWEDVSDGGSYAGATTSSLTINTVVDTDEREYALVATNSCSAVTSDAVFLDVSSLPQITQQPSSQSDCRGESVLFRTAATGGSGSYTYYWERKRPVDAAFNDATNDNRADVSIPGEMLVGRVGRGASANGTLYRVTITDDCGNSVTSLEATLTVNFVDSVAIVHETICQGEGTSFTMTTTGSTPIEYRWRKYNAVNDNWPFISDGGAYSGATTATLIINNATPNEAGQYSARATFNITVPNNNNATTCNENDVRVFAELTVDEGPDIVASIPAQTICSGTAITDIVLSNANGTPGTTYYWERSNVTALSGIPANGPDATISGTLTSATPGTPVTTIFTITATANGCESTSQVSVTVEDTEAPTVANCTSDIVVNTDPANCNSVVSYTLPTFNDNCDGSNLTGTLIAGFPSDTIFPFGTTTVTYEYYDAAGNGPVTCSFDVTINDNEPPNALCDDITVYLDALGDVTITANDVDGGTTDGCGLASLNIDVSDFDCSHVGANTVILTATDLYGNSSTCTSNVTIADTVSPVAICKDETVYLDASGDATLTTSDINNGSNDACGLASLTLSPSSFSCADIGTKSVSLSVTDYSGNLARCTANITVLDTISPEQASCPSNISVDATAGLCGAVVNYVTPTFNDNCDGNGLAGIMVSGFASGETFPTGATTVAYSYTDAAGNGPISCSFDVTVTDNLDPVVICQNITVQLDATGNVTITPADIDNGSSDNCGAPTLSLDITAFDCSHLGDNVVSLTATDGVGNDASCNATVTVADDTNPVDITATVSQQDTLCLDDNTTVNIATIGGVGTLSYTLDGTINATGVFNVPAGYNYAWNVTNALGCGTSSGNFFVEIHPDAGTPLFTVGATTLCQDSPNEIYTATASNSNSVGYSVAPGSAGTIDALTGEINWDAAFSGVATITASATGYCNVATEDLTVTVTPTVGTPSAIAVDAGAEPVCQLINGTTTTTYGTTASNNTGFNWSISNPAAGTIDPVSGIMSWSSSFAGTVNIQVTANGCNGPSAQVVHTVNITPTVGTPSIPTPADEVICQGSVPTSYTTLASDATSYDWTVTGAGNTISGTGTTGVVTWDPTFSGTATISVTANGCNGPSVVSSTSVTVLPTPQVTVSLGVSVCQNISPDAEVIFTNLQSLPVTLTYNINLGASQTINIAANSSATVTNSTTIVDDFIYTMESVQYQSGPACANPLSGSATVTIRPEAPVAPGVITGIDYVLPAVTETYTIAVVPNASNYTWTLPAGWTIVAGQGTESISVTTGIAGQDGDISVIASNDCGDSPASALAVTINPNLAIVAQLVDQSDCYYNSVLFSVSISGGALPIVYTWQRKIPTDVAFTDIIGDPDITYPIDGSMLVSNIGGASNPGGTEYRVRITDNAGSDLTSNAATLTVNQVLSMLPTTVLTTVCEGEAASFSATSDGEIPISMVWEKDGVPVADDAVITGATTTAISFTNIRPSDAGEYRLSVTFPMTQPNDNPGNPDNCAVVSILYRTLVVNPLPVLAGPLEVCVGQTINWTPNSGGTWTSSNPAVATISNVGLVTGIDAGTLTFSFTETATACTSITPDVTVHPLPTASISGNSDICIGDSTTFTIDITGAAPWDLTYTDGTTPVTVSAISSSPLVIKVSPNTSASYTLVAVNDIFCDATSIAGSADVTVHDLPTATLSGDATICVGSSTDLTINLTGSQPWSITYTDGTTPVTITGIASSPYALSVTPDSTTTYSLTAVSDVLCSGTSFAGDVTLTVDQLPTASAGGSETICENGFAIVSGAESANGTISWVHDGTGSLIDVTTLTPTYNAATADAGNTVTLTMTVTSNNSCSAATPAEATYTVLVDPLPSATAGGSQSICTNGTATVSSASAANGTILWTHDGAGTFTGDTTLTPVYTAVGLDSETTVTLILTVTSDNSCAPQIDTASYSVNVLPEAQVNQPDDQEVCTGESTSMITFNTTNTVGATTYSWTNSEPSINLAASGTGNLIAPFTANNSSPDPIIATIVVSPHLTSGGVTCDGPSKTFTILVNPMPVAIAPIGLTFCNDILSDTFVLSGTPSGVLFDISGGASIGLADVDDVSAIPAFMPVEGTASITIIPKFNGCEGLPVSFNIIVRPTPTVSISGGDVVCQNSAPPSISFTNPMLLPVVLTYDINGISTHTVNIPDRSNVSIAAPTNVGGVFDYNLVSVQYLDSDPPACVNTSISGTATIEVIALPVPGLSGPTDICAETTGNVYKTEAGMTNYTWVISAGGNPTAGGGPTDSTVTVTWATGGAHNISVRYNNTYGCGAATPTVFPVNVFSLPIPTITGSTSACVNETETYSTQPGMSNYVWLVSSGASITAGGGDENTVTVTWTSDGPQMISVNYTSADGCDAIAQTDKNITVNPLPVPILSGPNTVCEGTTGHVYTTDASMSTYIWIVSSGGNITSGGSANSNTATITWNADGAQTVSISYIDPSTGCIPELPVVFDVAVDSMPTPTISGPTDVCVGSVGNVYTTEPGMNNYVWAVSAGGSITSGGTGSESVTVTWSTATAGTVSVNYENGNGCSAAIPTNENINVNALPSPIIGGDNEVCVGETKTYSTVAGMSNYQWTIPAGVTLVSGGGVSDEQLTVLWNSAGAETISLNYTNSNACAAVSPTDFGITVNDLPSPSIIRGPTDVCTGGAADVYATQAGQTAYVWSVTGGTITAGGSASDSTVSIVWNTVGSQTVSVNYYNSSSCAAATPVDYAVNVLAPSPPTCPADMNVCSSDAAFILSGGNPTGGIYSGAGVSFSSGDYWFDPAVAGAGTHNIAYTLTNICADECVFTIDVTETPVSSASDVLICSGYLANVALNTAVLGTTFSWTSNVTAGSVSGNTNCLGACGTMIGDTLVNNQVVAPGSSGTNAIVEYTITASNGNCTYIFTVEVDVRPQIKTYNLTWNSNFVEDFIEVCAGSEALSDNDIEILDPDNGSLVGSGAIPNSWLPADPFLYSSSPSGPWTAAPGYIRGNSYYEWVVDLAVNNRLGYHYFVLRIVDPVTGCEKYSNPAILNVVSTLTVEAGDPIYICGGSTETLDGAYVAGYSGSTGEGRWTITDMNPAHGSSGTLSNTGFTSNPNTVSYTPPSGYVGRVTLTLTTNDPSGTCTAITDTRTLTVVPATSFNGCYQLANWPEDHNNSDGNRDDGEEPCLVTLVGSDNQSNLLGTTDITHCSGDGTISFDWAFLAPPNKIVWHQEDQKVSTGLSVSAPDNISAGDLIIVTIHVNDNNLSFSGSGFTEIETATHNSRNATVASFYKIATASEPGSYSFNVSGGSVGSNDRILASRITGHDASNPIGSSNGVTAAWSYTSGEEGYRTITVPGVSASAGAMLVAALAVEIDGDTELEYSNAPIGMTTVYYNDNETSSRVATDIVSGSTGNRSFQWPSYNSRNRDDMDAAALIFTINRENNEEDAAYYLLNGTPTFLSSTNGSSGSRTVTVESGDTFGFRVGTDNNTGGPGNLIIYNLTMPNDVPELSGLDSIVVEDCQLDTYIPAFEEPISVDDCGTPVILKDSLGNIDIDNCERSQTKTWVFVDDCESESLPFEQTVKWSVFEPITIECPVDPNLTACTDTTLVKTEYANWIAGFVATGGCDLITNAYAVPPLILSNIACGDTLIFEFKVNDGCGQRDSCISTFTVQPITTFDVFCPNDTSILACPDSASITDAYNAWRAGFGFDSECAEVTDNMLDFPPLTDLSCGGQLEFIYQVYNSCGEFRSCASTFTVEPPEALTINVPAGVSLPLCSKTTDIQTAYDAWKAAFTLSGGCNVIHNLDSIPDLGDITCGGTLSFTFEAQNANSACPDLQQGTSTFSVAEAPTLIVECPVDPNIAGCLGIQAITDAYDTWVDGFRATGGCAITTNIDSIPPLGDMVCNGQLSFTFVVGNDSTLCSEYVECTSTFTIGAAPALAIVAPEDTVVTGCNTNQTVIDAFNTWKSSFSYTGGCVGYVSFSDLSVYDLPSSCGGTVEVEYSVWDNCGQLVTDSASFTLNPDVIAVNAPLDEVQAACQTQAEIDLAFDVWKGRFGFTGGCGTVGTPLDSVSAPNACGGTIVVNYSAQDVCGQVVNTSAIFTIDLPSTVLQEPSFDLPVDINIYRNDSCNYDADPLVTGEPTNLTDNCTAAGNLSMSYNDSIVAGACTSEIFIYRKWIIADNCLNETTATQLIVVSDTTPPVLVCAADINGVADNGECDASSLDLGSTTATDNCLLASLVGVRDDGLLITDPFPVGVTRITWTATDACGNVSTCLQIITLIDGPTQPPVITCPADVIQDASPNNCYLENVVIPDPVATDNCQVALITWEMTGATTGTSPATGLNYVGGETFNVGLTTVTYTAADSAGNAASCAFTVTIKDITPPEITANCVSVSENADPGECSKDPATLFDPVYNDDCWPDDSLTVRWEMTGATTGTGNGFVTDSVFNVGITTVTYYVSDPDGNEANCSFTVTILDVTPPVITAGCTDVSESAASDECSKIPTSLVPPDYYDTCWPKDSLVLSYTITGATTGSGNGLVSGVLFNVGVSTVTYTVTDPDNNSANCSFTVTILDVTPPVIDIGDCIDVTDVAAPDSCSKIPGTLVDPDYSDTCWPKDSLVLTYTITGATTGSGLGSVAGISFNVGVSTVTYTVADPDGNTDDCSFTVTIMDVTPPSINITGCENVTDTTAANNCDIVSGIIDDPIYSDDCWPVDSLTLAWEMTGATTGTGFGSVSGETFNVGITSVTYTVSDPDGNADDCTFTVTIIPFNPPAFSAGCPPDVNGVNDPGVCGANLTIPVPTVNDLCVIGYVVTNDITGTDDASGYYPVDTSYVVWTITPTVGTPTTCTQMVIVVDVEDPIITTCAIDQNTVGCDSTAAALSPAFSNTLAETDYATFSDITNQGAATDNCAIVRVTYIDATAGVCPLVITRTWTVFDAAGNSASCDQTITIGETEAPVVICPPNLETPSVFDSTFAEYNIPAFDISDNCTDSVDILIDWTISGATTATGTGLIPSPYRFNRGISTVDYTFTDACGNPTTCSFTVHVLYPPEITCLPPDTLNTDVGGCFNHMEPGDADNPGVPTNVTGETLDWTWTVYDPDGVEIGTGTSTGISPDQVGPVDFPIGTSTIHWYAENLSGHDECDQLITVEDKQPPTFTANPFEDCVESLSHALYTGDVDAIDYNPDYPVGDYKLMEIGDTYLDIDLSTYMDNCCVLADGYTMHWEIDFEGNDPSEPSISGAGQPSTYINGVTGFAQDIFLWGDGVTFLSRTHTISYWIIDCNGNESLPVTADIIITPRPELIKITN